MKRTIVFVMTLALVISPCFYKMVKAKEIKGEEIQSQERKPEDTAEGLPVENEAKETEKMEDTEEPLLKSNADTESGIMNEEPLHIEEGTAEDSEDETDSMIEEKLSLQVPQGIEIVMDPWEMDGKEQIYSNEYIVKNCGKTAGHLVLSELTCKTQTDEIRIQTDKEGLHYGDEKSLYIEMVFGDGEKIILSQEDSRYETDLEPGEEVSFCFLGEVNEYASVDWTGSDIVVNVVYSWEAEPEEKNILPENDDPTELPTDLPKEKDETITEKMENEKKDDVQDLLQRKDKADLNRQKTDDIEETEKVETAEAEERGIGINELAEDGTILKPED